MFNKERAHDPANWREIGITIGMVLPAIGFGKGLMELGIIALIASSGIALAAAFSIPLSKIFRIRLVAIGAIWIFMIFALKAPGQSFSGDIFVYYAIGSCVLLAAFIAPIVLMPIMYIVEAVIALPKWIVRGVIGKRK